MQNETRTTACRVNPLIGASAADTIENLVLCLDNVGRSLAARHEDPSIVFFCASLAAALRYEQQELPVPANRIGHQQKAANS